MATAKKESQPKSKPPKFTRWVENPKKRSDTLSPDLTREEIDAMRELERRPKPGGSVADKKVV